MPADAPPCVGVFIAQVHDAYQRGVLRGIREAAAEANVGLISFVGHRALSPLGFEAAENIAYRLANDECVDGLIILSTTIATFLDGQGARRLFADRGIAQVSVGMEIEGVPSIVVDGAAGSETLVQHLIRDHGRRRLAFIGGPVGHPEADQREAAFRRVLAAEGLVLDEGLMSRGTFLKKSGKEAIASILAVGRPFDALVCANDVMALGAMESLESAGYRIPEDIAIVGFDGIEEGAYQSLPLSTVYQPLHELGRQSFFCLMAAMAGQRPKNIVLSGAPLLRRSCGCPPLCINPLGSHSPLAADPTAALSQPERELCHCLARLLSQGNDQEFIDRFDAEIRSRMQEGYPLSPLEGILKATRQLAFSDGSPPMSQKVRLQAIELMESSHGLLAQSLARAEASKRVQAEQRMDAIRALSATLSGTFDLDQILRRLTSTLYDLGISRGFLVLFDADDAHADTGQAGIDRGAYGPAPYSHSTLILDSVAIGAPPEGFSTAKLLPSRLDQAWRRGNWLLLPLVFQGEQLGYLLLSGDSKEAAIYPSLRDQISSAIKGARLMARLRLHERSLEEAVAARTAELLQANQALSQEVGRRQRLERDVRAISDYTMQKIGQDLHDDLCQHLAGIALFASASLPSIEKGDGRTAAIMRRIMSLLESSIIRAKQIARGLYPPTLEEGGLALALADLTRVVAADSPVQIDFLADPGFSLPSADHNLQAYRIVQEALTNAVKHSGSPLIEIRLQRQLGGSLAFWVRDYGQGLPAKPARGMGLRIMQCRAESLGAKLSMAAANPGFIVRCELSITEEEHDG